VASFKLHVITGLAPVISFWRSVFPSPLRGGVGVGVVRLGETLPSYLPRHGRPCAGHLDWNTAAPFASGSPAQGRWWRGCITDCHPRRPQAGKGIHPHAQRYGFPSPPLRSGREWHWSPPLRRAVAFPEP